MISKAKTVSQELQTLDSSLCSSRYNQGFPNTTLEDSDTSVMIGAEILGEHLLDCDPSCTIPIFSPF